MQRQKKFEKRFDFGGKSGYNVLCMTMEQVSIMFLNLAKIIDCPGGAVPFETTLDLHELQFGTVCPAQTPVRAHGTVRNTAGVLMLEGTVSARLDCVCDRCAKPFVREVEFPLQAVLVTELQDLENEDENLFLLHGNDADLDEIVTTAFVLNMSPKMLCSPDCKGLCPTCGKDLNEGPCGCRPEADPRLAVLQKFFEKS